MPFLTQWGRKIWAWYPRGMKLRITVLAMASSNLPEAETRGSQRVSRLSESSESEKVWSWVSWGPENEWVCRLKPAANYFSALSRQVESLFSTTHSESWDRKMRLWNPRTPKEEQMLWRRPGPTFQTRLQPSSTKAGQSNKLLLALVSTFKFGLRSRRVRAIFLFLPDSWVFWNGDSSLREEGSDYHWSLLLYWRSDCWLTPTHSLCHWVTCRPCFHATNITLGTRKTPRYRDNCITLIIDISKTRHLHSPTPLIPGEQLPLPIGYENVWAP
jgi:hypothetical protein